MSRIHPTAVVAATTVLGEGSVVGPYCIVGPEVVLEDGVELHSHVIVEGRTRLGRGTKVYSFASLGQPGQIYKNSAEIGSLDIGVNCEIREHVTINCGSPRGDMVTRVGADCMLMVGAHVAHDCQVGEKVIFANNATLGGHVTIGDHVFLGGLSAVHQFVTIGEHAIVGGISGVRGNIIPFGRVNGATAVLEGLNVIGLERRGFERPALRRLDQAYKKLFHGAGVFADRIAAVAAEYAEDVNVMRIVDFIRSVDKRRPLTLP